MPQVTLSMYDGEVSATEKALRLLVNSPRNKSLQDLRAAFTLEEWSELQDAWCRVFATLVSDESDE